MCSVCQAFGPTLGCEVCELIKRRWVRQWQERVDEVLKNKQFFPNVTWVDFNQKKVLA